jgi:hypothetical protein
LFLTYEALARDLEGCLRQVIAICYLEVPPEKLPLIVERSSYAFMKQQENKFDPNFAPLFSFCPGLARRGGAPNQHKRRLGGEGGLPGAAVAALLCPGLLSCCPCGAPESHCAARKTVRGDLRRARVTFSKQNRPTSEGVGGFGVFFKCI